MANLHDPAAAVSPPSSTSPSGPDAASPLDLSPAWQAGLLLAAGQVARAVGLEGPPVATILQATGASRSLAYEMRGRVLDQLTELHRPPGRPPAPPEGPPETGLRAELSGHMLRYVRSHPGSISAGLLRQHYSDGLRRFVLELRERYAHFPLSGFAEVIQIPADTLADWLRAPPPEPGPEPAGNDDRETAPPRDAIMARAETVIQAWKHWSGAFSDFCDHVRYHLRIDWGRTTISGILHQHGIRTPRRRPARSPDEKALRGQFETFFPGAQWVGDGTPIAVHVAGERFVFNLELVTDTGSGAFAGFDVREHEDSDAVAHAFAGGVRTTADFPLALLLDNRPCNHTPEVYEALGPTLLIPSTPGRAQNKAHTEGAFGLFQQQVPPLVLHSREPRHIAQDLLTLITETWARTLNHRPRPDRGGRSRVQLYSEAEPTPDELSQAREALRERLRKQQLAAQTRRARLDPAVRHSLDQAFHRLGLSDPTGNLRDAIAAYPHDVVIEAISIFEGKQNAHTLPPDTDARYLLGIARNLSHEREGFEIAQALWRERLAARDHALSHLDSQRRHLEHDIPSDDPFPLLKTFVDHALATDRLLDRFFWLQAAADAAIAPTSSPLEPLFRTAARRIFATHRVPYTDRLAAVRFLAAKLLPLDHLHFQD